MSDYNFCTHFKSVYTQVTLFQKESIVKYGAKEEYAQLRIEMNLRIEITFH